MMTHNLFDFSHAKLTTLLTDEYHQSKFRATQLFNWIYDKGVRDFSLMSDIAKDFRLVLAQDFSLELPTLDLQQVSNDGTIKALVNLADGQKVEAVLMRYRYGQVACISSQVGCAMNCAFCATGTIKKIRSLRVSEMVGQLLLLNDLIKDEGLKVSHIVIMGMGEPFDNYENVMDFIRIANDHRAFEIGARHISVSTCGLVPQILQYGQEGLQTNLAISLHAPNNELRNQIMPINKAYPLEVLIPAIKEYNRTTKRRATLEYILIDGFNDSLKEAQELYHLIRGLDVSVNLIPFNEVAHFSGHRSHKENIHTFFDFLQQRRVNATIRKEFGHDIDASCGQLRARYNHGN